MYKNTHTYQRAGEYFIEIFCEEQYNFPGFCSKNFEWTDKLIEIVDWGLFPILSFESAFKNANLLTKIPNTYMPLHAVNFNSCFENCFSLMLR